MTKLRLISLCLLLFQAQYILAQRNFTEPASADLIQEIYVMESLLFDAAFENCNADHLARYVADDFDFYHDEWGRVAQTGKDFAAGLGGSCQRQAEGKENRQRRELVLESMEVFPLNNYGALQRGRYLFYQEKAGRFVFTESGQFTHIWKKEEGKWKVTRVMSYDHAPE